MAERTVIVRSSSGLHARPAALFVRAAGKQPAAVRIRLGDGPTVDARSMLSVLSLGAGCGAEVTLSADGDGADDAVAALADLLSRDLDAEEPASSQ
jgi:phosphocarrier protein